MIIYYRLTGLVASFALVYYTIVMLAIFRLVPVTLTLAGIAGFVLSVGMAVDANILIFERMKEELRVGKALPAAVEAGFNRAWNSILDSNVSSLITATILYALGSSVIRGFALVLIIGVLVSMFSAIVVTRTVLRMGRPPGLGAQAGPVRPPRRRVRRARAVRPSPAARRAVVFDIIGKRRWFYIISLAITIPGLFFILLTPFTDAGLQFTIDYTGGTRWEIPVRGPERDARTRSRRSSPSTASSRRRSRPDRASSRSRPRRSACAAPATVAVADHVAERAAARRLGRSASASASASPSASAAAAHRAAPPRAGAVAPRRASASPSAAPTPELRSAPPPRRVASVPVRRPGASPSTAARRRWQHPAPEPGHAWRDRRGAPGRARPDRRAAQPDDDRRGRQLRPDQPGAHPDPRRLARHPALDHLPVPRRQVRRDGARRAAPRRHRRRRYLRDPRARSSASRSTPCS